MKSLTAMMVLTLTWGAAEAAAKSKPALDHVAVYLSLGPVNFSGTRMTMATSQANRLFEAAGIKLDWKDGIPKKNEMGRVVVIRFVATAPACYSTRENSNVMASAMPYGERPLSITVFGDRVGPLLAQFNERLAGRVLGHVLAHELGHVLEGVARHSEAGLMKAHWTTPDFIVMGAEGLALDAHDVDLLRNSFGGKLTGDSLAKAQGR